MTWSCPVLLDRRQKTFVKLYVYIYVFVCVSQSRILTGMHVQKNTIQFWYKNIKANKLELLNFLKFNYKVNKKLCLIQLRVMTVLLSDTDLWWWQLPDLNILVGLHCGNLTFFTSISDCESGLSLVTHNCFRKVN